MYSISELITQLNHTTTDFNLVIQTIDQHYNFAPVEFKNGSLLNAKNCNNGACKIFAFGQLHQLSEQATLNAFGDFYTHDVLQAPDEHTHPNIRNFMQSGWKGIVFKTFPLTLKSSCSPV